MITEWETEPQRLGEGDYDKRHLWSIILAGGEGERTRKFVRSRFGIDKPKQYCTFVGSRSLLQHTVDRADRLGSSERRVIVAARHHRFDIEEQLDRRPGGSVLFQPQNRGTAPGVFLPLARVLATDPDAEVAILPSDHFIYPEERFLETMWAAVQLSRTTFGCPVLLGVEPESPEPEYGWIEAGRKLDSTGSGEVRSVERFVEKPSREAAEQIASRGGLWNTSIVAVKGAVLWKLGWRCLPWMMPSFTAIREAFVQETKDQARVRATMDRVYSQLATRDFSRHLLEPAAGQLLTMKLESCSWSDWGSPARILDTLARLGKRPGREPRRREASLGATAARAAAFERAPIGAH